MFAGKKMQVRHESGTLLELVPSIEPPKQLEHNIC